MKIRTSLLFSYLIFVVLIIFISLVFRYIIVDVTKTSFNNISKITQNVLYNENILLADLFRKKERDNAVFFIAEINYLIAINLRNSSIHNIFKNKIVQKIINKNLTFHNKSVGYLLIIDDKKNIIFHSDKIFEKSKISDWSNKYPELLFFINSKKSSGEKYFYNDIKNKEIVNYLYYERIKHTKYSFVVVYYVNEFLASYKMLLNRIQKNVLHDIWIYYQELSKQYIFEINIIVFFIIIVCVFFSSSLAFVFSSFLAKPINNLGDCVSKLGNGEFTIELKEKRAPKEIIDLIDKFNQLGNKLNIY
ncbi:MAG: hypothetical protein WC860_03170, partial [Candidatus Margulisiibacteriota bacterium]